MKLKTLLFASLLGIAAPLVTGCTITAEPGEEAGSHVGTVEMELGTVSASGVAYQLRSANFTITDVAGNVVTTLHSEDAPPDAPVLTTDLNAGDYNITLENGWFMERGSGELVEAALISPQTQLFRIFDNFTSQVPFSFKVEGEAIVFSGSLDVRIQVGECRQDPFEPNDTQAEAALVTFVPVQASVCGDDDWFTFQLAGADGSIVDLTIDFVHANGDIDMALTQPDGTTLISQGTTNQEHIQVLRQTGAYFLRVYGFRGAVGDFTFTTARPPTM